MKAWLILWILDTLKRKLRMFFFVEFGSYYGRFSIIWRVCIRYINYLEILLILCPFIIRNGDETWKARTKWWMICKLEEYLWNILDTLITSQYWWFCTMKYFPFQRNWRQKIRLLENMIFMERAWTTLIEDFDKFEEYLSHILINF